MPKALHALFATDLSDFGADSNPVYYCYLNAVVMVGGTTLCCDETPTLNYPTAGRARTPCTNVGRFSGRGFPEELIQLTIALFCAVGILSCRPDIRPA